MAKKTTPAPVGARFVVTEETQFKVGERLIANYLVGRDYRVTDLNCEFVGAMIADGTAVLTGTAASNQAGGSAVTG